MCVCAQEGMKGEKEGVKVGESGRKTAANDFAGETSFGCGLCVIWGLGGSPPLCKNIY